MDRRSRGRRGTGGREWVYAAATLLGDEDDRAGGSPEALERLLEFTRRLTGYCDRVVAAARVATRDFSLWNAFLRCWLLWSIVDALAVKRARLQGAGSGDWSSAQEFETSPFWFSIPSGLAPLLDDQWCEIESTVRDHVPASVAAERIFRRLRKDRLVPPLYEFGDPDARYYRFTAARRLRMALWASATAPVDFRGLLTAPNVTGAPTKGRSRA